MSQRRGLFVAGTDTGVGKTIVSAALMSQASETCSYWKPIQTGIEDDDDTRTIKNLARLCDAQILNQGCRFALPASPHYAAMQAQSTIDIENLCALASKHLSSHRTWVVEGVGGLMVPLNSETLLTDLIERLALPLLLVASTKLGTINHTLLTVEHIKNLAIPTLGIVMVGPTDLSATTGIEAHSDIPIIAHVPLLHEISPENIWATGRALMNIDIIAERFA